ncbi:MAG: GNAT family N-acetyltransferase [Henriciella sp.]
MTDPIILHTQRLSLRAPQTRDAVQITERIGVKDVAWNLGRAPYPYYRKDADAFILRASENWGSDKAYVFMLEHAKDGVIGCCGIDAASEDIWELGYWIGKPWWRQGYATEAASSMLDWAQESKSISKLIAGHYMDNPISGVVLKKLGFKSVGKLNLSGAARGKLSPVMRYAKGAPAEAALRLAPH